MTASFPIRALGASVAPRGMPFMGVSSPRLDGSDFAFDPSLLEGGERTGSIRLPIKGRVEIILDDDLPAAFYLAPWFPWVSGTGTTYIGCRVGRWPRRRSVLLHRLLLPVVHGFQVDHINRDTLDNRRGNLRAASVSQNGANRRLQKNNTSKYRGVVLRKKRYWVAQIKHLGTLHYLGCFDSAEAAAKAYDAAAAERFGQFAQLNFPQSRTEAR